LPISWHRTFPYLSIFRHVSNLISIIYRLLCYSSDILPWSWRNPQLLVDFNCHSLGDSMTVSRCPVHWSTFEESFDNVRTPFVLHTHLNDFAGCRHDGTGNLDLCEFREPDLTFSSRFVSTFWLCRCATNTHELLLHYVCPLRGLRLVTQVVWVCPMSVSITAVPGPPGGAGTVRQCQSLQLTVHVIFFQTVSRWRRTHSTSPRNWAKPLDSHISIARNVPGFRALNGKFSFIKHTFSCIGCVNFHALVTCFIFRSWRNNKWVLWTKYRGICLFSVKSLYLTLVWCVLCRLPWLLSLLELLPILPILLPIYRLLAALARQ
jgi:hypothetical protein